MFTRCPACHTVHPVNAALLTQGRGKYRCSKCNKVGNALLSLFDEWPEPGQQPSPIGDVPVLGARLDLDKAQQSRLNPEHAGLTDGDDAPLESTPGRSPWLRALWIGGAVVVVLAVIFKWAEFQGTPIIQKAEIDKVLVETGLKEPPPREIFRDLSLIHLVSRELASHPTQAGMLRLSATIVNRAPRRQPYPELEVILFDAAGSPLATYDFQPGDYLAGGPGARPGMSPQAYLPLTLDLEDPGDKAVGFELNFR